MTKRPDGSLERSVLAVLWGADEPITPAEVNQRLGQGHAYTSIATVLTRLHAKGQVVREPCGRGYAYGPAMAESELTADHLGRLLEQSSDRSAVLARFVGRLSGRDVATLRTLLQADVPPRPRGRQR